MKISVGLLIVCLLALGAHSAPTYDVQIVTDQRPASFILMNNNGDVASLLFNDGNDNPAFYWPYNGTLEYLNFTEIYAINDASQIVGDVISYDGHVFSAAMWQNGNYYYYAPAESPTNISTAAVTAINDKGQMGGEAALQPVTWTISNSALQPTRISSTVYTEPSPINDINNQGNMVGVVGNLSNTVFYSEGFYYTPSTGIQTINQSICSKYGPLSDAYMINERNTIAGYCWEETFFSSYYWILYNNNTLSYLGNLQVPAVINDYDDYVYLIGGQSWVVMNGTTYNLNSAMTTTLTNFMPTAINNNGWIAGAADEGIVVLIPRS